MTNSLHSEMVKVKRTSLIYLCFAGSAVVPVILLLDTLDGTPGSLAATDPWKAFYWEGQTLLSFLMFPLFILLSTTLLMQNEFRNNTWKQTLTAPQRFSEIYLAKFVLAQCLSVLFLVTYNFYMGLAALLVDLVYPDMHVLGYMRSWWDILEVTGSVFLASLGMSALHLWLALRFRNFVVPVGLGFVLWFIALTLLFELDIENVFMIPHVFTVLTMYPGKVLGMWQTIGLSVLYAIIFLTIGYRRLVARRSQG